MSVRNTNLTLDLWEEICKKKYSSPKPLNHLKLGWNVLWRVLLLIFRIFLYWSEFQDCLLNTGQSFSIGSHGNMNKRLFLRNYKLAWTQILSEKITWWAIFLYDLNTLHHKVIKAFQNGECFLFISGSTGSWPTSSFTSQRPDSARYVPGVVKSRSSSSANSTS